jgi:hypothetical protein
MADFLGFTAISIVSLITLIVGMRWPAIYKILLVALIVRVFLLLLGHYIIPLPGGNFDAEYFERKAWDFAQGGIFDVLSNFDLGPFVFFSSLQAIPYSLFGRSILMAQSIGLLFGIGSVFYSWKLANILWGERIAKRVGWSMALFPSLILYSLLFLREVYISFFLLLAVYGAVNWIKTKNYSSFFLSMFGFGVATLFHGSMIIAIIVFLSYVAAAYLKVLFKSLNRLKINLKILPIFLLCIIILGLFVSSKINVSYLNNFEESVNIDILIQKTYNSTKGGAAWPVWTIAKSGIELLYIAPLRSIYFLFSPFPWDVKKLGHIIGLFDAILYMYLVFLIFRNISVIWRDPSLRFILILLLCFIFVYGLGVGNFGTALRHKTKFTFMFVLLAAPLIKSFVFSKSNKKFN